MGKYMLERNEENIEKLKQTIQTKTKEGALKDKEMEHMKMEYELDKNKETIKQLQQSLNEKGDEIAVLENDLKNKGEVLKDNEAQTVQVIKMKYMLERNEENIKKLQQSVQAKTKEI